MLNVLYVLILACHVTVCPYSLAGVAMRVGLQGHCLEHCSGVVLCNVARGATPATGTVVTSIE